MEEKTLKINNAFFVNALRNCGYNNYSALSDIVDNSIEPNVSSSFVKIKFETENDKKSTKKNVKKIKSILVIDDGCGMDMWLLKEAMSLGSETGKSGDINLGKYGAGLKTASFSIGQVLEVFTKTQDSELNYAVISLEGAIKNNDDIIVKYASFNKESNEYEYFSSLVGEEHGTIVKISSLDLLSNNDYNNFTGYLKNKISENFNKFISSNTVLFYVEDKKVPYTDLVNETYGGELLGEDTFTVNGKNIRYKAWFLQENSNGGIDKDKESEKHFLLDKNSDIEYLPKTRNNQGLYIYRQNRLVGKAIVWSLWTRDYFYAPFRCEIFVDGNADSLFGSTFTKMIGETDRSNISQELWDKIASEIKPYATETKRRVSNKYKENNNTPEAREKLENFYKTVTDKQNSNMMLKGNRKGENKNKEKEKEEKEHKTRGKQQNPNSNKKRSNKWLDGFKEVPMGCCGEMYGISIENNRRIILINTDHKFYEKFYINLDYEMKFKMAQIISCYEIAKQEVGYYSSDEIQSIVDTYNIFHSNEVAKSLSF